MSIGFNWSPKFTQFGSKPTGKNTLNELID